MGKYICSIDRQTSIVMRNKRAVQLGYIQFNIFRLLHEARRSKKSLLTTRQIHEHIYNGTDNPAGTNNIPAVIGYANKKLKHLGLKIKGSNHREHSFYQIVVL